MASFGYFTLGLALAWPASALPSIRFVLVPILDAMASLAFGSKILVPEFGRS